MFSHKLAQCQYAPNSLLKKCSPIGLKLCQGVPGVLRRLPVGDLKNAFSEPVCPFVGLCHFYAVFLSFSVPPRARPWGDALQSGKNVLSSSSPFQRYLPLPSSSTPSWRTQTELDFVIFASKVGLSHFYAVFRASFGLWLSYRWEETNETWGRGITFDQPPAGNTGFALALFPLALSRMAGLCHFSVKLRLAFLPGSEASCASASALAQESYTSP